MNNKIQKASGENQKLVEKAVPYIGLGIVVLLVVSLLNGLSKMKSVALEIEKEQERVENLKKVNEELQNNLDVIQSEEYIDKQLRDNLGLAKEGEIVVILPDEEIVKKYAPRIEWEEDILPDPNWKKWMKLFGLLN